MAILKAIQLGSIQILQIWKDNKIYSLSIKIRTHFHQVIVMLFTENGRFIKFSATEGNGRQLS